MTRDIIIALVSLTLGFILGFSSRKQAVPDPPVVQVDTMYVHDTITRYKPEYVVRRVVDSIRVPVPIHDTLRYADTVYVQLPREQLEWSDSLATVWCSGFLPAVDSVRHYVTTQVIPVTKRTPAPRWGIGVQAGYGASLDGLTPYVGIGIHYNLLPLTR